ncbi:MAG: 2-enoyl thioester reductase domain-containing protein [Terrimicrobiaceae bacterium]|nr:2-enoyl thioester reductase domain-containing protein [Terrimicrobiaceae bacterium]
MMIAARLHAFGDVLSIEPLDLRMPAPDEVQLEMIAAPVNPADLNIIEGTYGRLPDLPATPGNEGVGRIAILGAEITHLQCGDLVAPLDPGSWCSRRNVRADRVIPLPAGIDVHQAAMLAINPPTAYALLHDFALLETGDWILQNAANSGVGRCVIQLAHRLGLRTLNVVRRAELAAELQALGADRVVTEDVDLRRDGAALMDGAEARLALNAVGGASALNVANALAPGSPLVTYGAMGRQPLKIPNGLLIFRGLNFHGFWLRRWFDTKPAAEQQRIFGLLAGMCLDGSLRVPIHRVFPLRELHAALREAAAEGRGGKVLLDPRSA